jgi:hypothetical protein
METKEENLTADGRRQEVIRGLGRRLNIRRLRRFRSGLRLRRCAMQTVVPVTILRTDHRFEPSVDFGLGSNRISCRWNRAATLGAAFGARRQSTANRNLRNLRNLRIFNLLPNLRIIESRVFVR